MRILHTADWHLGKTIEGRDRTKEQEDFLIEINDIANKESIDLVLIAGDVFQTPNPSAAAEELFYEYITQLSNGGKRGIVIIAGNHDNPERIKASVPLANKLGITIVGFPKDELTLTKNPATIVNRINTDYSFVELTIPKEKHHASVIALPYPSEGRLRELLSKTFDEKELHKNYNLAVKTLLNNTAKNFKKNSVNIILSHLFLNGGSQSDSENEISLGGAYSLDIDIFPESTQYVALGHLHRPQNIKGGPCPIRYAGSPLSYSFSEITHTKSVTIADILPQKAPKINEVFLSAGKPLVKWKAAEGLPQVRSWISENKDSSAWIDLELYVDKHLEISEIQELKTLHDGFLNIRYILKNQNEYFIKETINLANTPLNELFIKFYEKQKGIKPDEKVVTAFLDIVKDIKHN